MIMISLIGEQPIPNLLPICYQPPAAAVLVHSDFTHAAAQRLEPLLPAGCEPVPCRVSAYVFNLTGGTKAMALSTYLLAAELRAPFLYLQSEGKKTRLYRYEFKEGNVPQIVEDKLLPGLITIDDYLRAFVGDYNTGSFANDDAGGRFERAIHAALHLMVDEIAVSVWLAKALEVDFVVRCDNQVGIIEAKTGRNKIKAAIDQLNTAGGQHYLGTYTQKMLVSDLAWDKSFSNLRELATARRIQVIELPSFREQGELSDEDADRLAQSVCQYLGRNLSD
jgi:hypothetical protein